MDKPKRTNAGGAHRPRRVRVFVASPSDVASERDTVSYVVSEGRERRVAEQTVANATRELAGRASTECSAALSEVHLFVVPL
jgi:hypothetical protein